MKLTKKQKKQNLLLAGIILAAAALLITSFFVISHFRTQNTQRNEKDVSDPYANEDEDALTYYQGKWYRKKENLDSFLMMGTDQYQADSFVDGNLNNQDADFLLLLVMDNDAQTCTALQLNRDTMVTMDTLDAQGNVTGSATQQLALAHVYGSGGTDSCRNTVNAVSNLLMNTEIQHYASVTMDAVKILNDVSGGVSVQSLDDFNGNGGLTVKAGDNITLTGDQALAYVRARQGMDDSTNLHRMQRQKQYLQALQQQFGEKCKQSTTFFADAVLKISDYLTSDCDVYQLQDLNNKYQSYQLKQLDDLTGNGTVNADNRLEYTVDSESVQRAVLELFYEQTEK